MANSMIRGEFESFSGSNVRTLLYSKVYSYAWPSSFSISANGSKTLTADNFGFSTPSGYKIAGLGRFTSGSVHVSVSAINLEATGTSGAMTLHNLTDSAQTEKTSYIEIIYIRNDFILSDKLVPV